MTTTASTETRLDVTPRCAFACPGCGGQLPADAVYGPCAACRAAVPEGRPWVRSRRWFVGPVAEAHAGALRVGSLCSGYGGLDLALAQVLDVETVWHCENDQHASRVLAHHWPDIPNLGDLTTVDWAAVEPVDVVTAGFPCQPVSEAGRRAGVTDERWLFDDIAAAVGRMVVRPRLLVFENVRGLLTANGGDAMARVVHGLARLGYVGSWRTLRASDVGAPHRRERVFLVAADARGPAGRRPGDTERGHGSTTPGGRGAPQPGGRRGSVADADRQRLPWRPQPDSGTQRPGLATPRRDDPRRLGGAARGGSEPAVANPARLSQSHEPFGGNEAGQHECAVDRASHRDWPGDPAQGVHDLERAASLVAWGPYEPAIRRWERILGRPAPRPTDTTGRLSLPFVEWMLGLPAGWVTAVPGVSRSAQLRILGNGVVPQQGAVALASLLDDQAAAA